MAKDTIRKYHELSIEELRQKQILVEAAVQEPKVTFSNKVRNFLESFIFMGATIGTVVMGVVGAMLLVNPKMQKKYKIEDPVTDATKIKRISLTAGMVAGGVSAVVNMIGNHRRLKEEQAADNASKLYYIDRLIERKEGTKTFSEQVSDYHTAPGMSKADQIRAQQAAAQESGVGAPSK